MTVTIQRGLDAEKFQQLLYNFAIAGAEADAKARRLKHEALVKLQDRPEKAQGSLFE